jgi:hypothetical protein
MRVSARGGAAAAFSHAVTDAPCVLRVVSEYHAWRDAAWGAAAAVRESRRKTGSNLR